MIGVVGDSISAPSYPSVTGQTVPSGQYVAEVAYAAGDSYTVNAKPGVSLHTVVGNLPAYYPVGATNLIVFLGTNDAYQMATNQNATEWGNDWDTLYTFVRAQTPLPSVTVVSLLPTLYGMNCPWAYDDAYLIDYLDAITRELCYQNGHLWVRLNGVTADMMRADHHPNLTGHGYIAAQIRKRWGI